MHPTIIIADDDPELPELFRLIFAKEDYNITFFKNGDALVADDFAVPDLFILDKQLSGTDGVEICRLLKQRERTKAVPVILLSANPNIEQLSADARADGYLEKPFNIKDLQQLVKEFVGNKQ